MGQLQQIVEQDFHIPIDYYALIDYTAFKDAVNAVGGINIDIQSPDPRGLYDPNVAKADGGPVRLPNGPVHLNGSQAFLPFLYFRFKLYISFLFHNLSTRLMSASH